MNCLIWNVIILVEVFYSLTTPAMGNDKKTINFDPKEDAKILMFKRQQKCISPWVTHAGICILYKTLSTWRDCARICGKEKSSIMWLENSDEQQTACGLLTHVLGIKIWYHLALRRFHSNSTLFNYGTPYVKNIFKGRRVEGEGLEKGKYFQAPSDNFILWSSIEPEDAHCVCRKFWDDSN